MFAPSRTTFELMHRSSPTSRKILIIGGTSGLGLELARLLLYRGYDVIVTGRKETLFPEYKDHFKFFRNDLDNLEQTAILVKELCKSNHFDIVVNNAGILSPPCIITTKNGLEYTFQINFLSHLLIDEIILRNNHEDKPVLIAAVTSPVYRIAKGDLAVFDDKSEYRAFKAYSNSKLYLAMMCKYFVERFPLTNLICIGFDPGIFSSGIDRMQNRIFRRLYTIASPFMRKPEKVAKVMAEILERKDLISSSVYDHHSRIRAIPQTNESVWRKFWEDCYQIIGPFLQ
jgi:NAD(P)-dependent dehydrogenase (short-subunit alcohol dehydrogenase family)